MGRWISCLVLYFSIELVRSCGVPTVTPNLGSNRIVGGKEAVAHSWPWMAGIYRLGTHWCGGTLVNNQWVVTAAHCLDGRHRRAVDPEDPSYFTVVLGDHRRSMAEGTEQTRSIEKIVMSPYYDMSNVNRHDIALIKLRSPVTFNKYVQPSCVVNRMYSYVRRDYCIILGWGTTRSSSDSDDVLRQASVPLVRSTVCGSSSYYGKDYEASTMVCAGFRTGRVDGCQRDSGGPLLCKDNGRWNLVGVTSWGYGCALPYKPGVYTKVSAYSEWIANTIAG